MATSQIPVHETTEVSGALRFGDTQASVFLDLVRGVAACIVLLDHWRNIFFVDRSAIHAYPMLFAIPWLIVSAGHQAVVIFFVLSGYLIAGSVYRSFARKTWSWRSYSLHRLARLWIVLIPGLVLTSLFDRTGMHLHRAPAVALYAGVSGDHVIGDVHRSAGALIALGNLFFLQTIRVPIFGSDGALWSLANEFWYYLLFPLALIVLRRETKMTSRVLCAILFAGLAFALRNSVLSLFPVWLMGALLALAPIRPLSRAWRIGAAVVYVPAFYLFCLVGRVPALSRSFPSMPADYLLGTITVAFLWILLSARSRNPGTSFGTRVSRLLARLSYTLYVLHTPLLVLLAALLMGPDRWQPTLAHLGVGFGVLVIVFLVTFAVAWCTEFRTDAVRRRIEGWVGLRAG